MELELSQNVKAGNLKLSDGSVAGFFHHWIMYTDNDGLFSTMKDAIAMKGEAEPTHFMPLPTGKEGEIVRVLLEALKYYDNLHSGDNTALEALAKAEELAGEV